MSWKSWGVHALGVMVLLLVGPSLRAFDEPKAGDKASPKEAQGDKGAKKEDPEANKFNFPSLDDFLKNLPENTDVETVERMKKEYDRVRQQFQKQVEDLKKRAQGGQGGQGFGGGFGVNGGIPGGGGVGFGGGFPGGGPGGFPGMPGMKLAPGRLGIEALPVSEVLVDQLDLPAKKGLVVDKVLADSAAAKAGLKKNDIILEFNGKEVTNDPMALRKIVAEMKNDEPIDAQVLRKGKKEMVKGIKLPEPKKDAKGGLFPGGDKGGFPFPDKGGFPFPDKGGFPGGDKGGFPMPPGGLFPGMPPGMFPQQLQPVPISIRDDRLES